MASNRNTAGGSATQIGINYQNRVAAWCCTQILAGQETSPVWRLPSESFFKFLRCETEQPVDDILIGTSLDGFIFINVKHTVKLSRDYESTFASVINQFVRQFTAFRTNTGTRPWERKLNSGDRLLLVTSSSNSKPLKESLSRVLLKIRDLTLNEELSSFIKDLPVEEQEVLETLRHQIAHSWLNTIGTKIEEVTEIDLLKLIWVEILDVDENTIGEREAKNLLRTILQDSNQSEVAWNTLIQLCANYASRHSGADRSILQSTLLDLGILIKVLKSYSSDIEKLRLQSSQTLHSLEELSKFRVGENIIKINRQSTVTLRNAAENDSMVVVGEPGAGKSGTLHDLVKILIDENRDVLFFAVDRLEAKSINSLRNELDLEHNLDEILKNWSNSKPGFLIIDALDAARSESAAQTFYDLISLTLKQIPSWRVIVSIRQFDLRHNKNLRRLFAGSPPTKYQDNEFYDLYHFNVPPLNENEWLEILTKSNELAALVIAAKAADENDFLVLLANPFNLRIVSELVGNGIAIKSLTPIKTRIGLLDCYWDERVIRNDYESDTRQLILLKMVQSMIKARNLRVNRLSIANGQTSQALKQLLSSHVLSESFLPSGVVENNILTFSHHVLFDYAVSFLLFRADESFLIQSLEENFDLVLTVRPSIVMYFEHLWINDPDLFWENYFNLIESQKIPEIGKLIGASVIADHPSNLANFAPFIKALSTNNIQHSQVAEKAFRHLTGALLIKAVPSSITKLIGENAPPWCELLNICSNPLNTSRAYSIRPLLWKICENFKLFTAHQRNEAGEIARRLFRYALSQEPPDSAMVFAGIETVSKTFESNPVESAELLRKCLEPVHVINFGHEELYRMAQEIEHLVNIDPKLVGEMFIAAFTYNNFSDDQTYKMRSPAITLTSTVKQDWDSVKFSFTQHFPQLLKKVPFEALKVAIKAVNTYVYEKKMDRLWNTEVPHEVSIEQLLKTGTSFNLNDHEVFIIDDYSSIWDDSIGSHDVYGIQLLSYFGEYLQELSKHEENSELLHQILNEYMQSIEFAVFWRRLIIYGARNPERLGYAIRSLAWSIPILNAYDTSIEIGNFLKVIFSILPENERALIEDAILKITELVDDDQREYAEINRNRLLGCLDKNSIVSVEVKDLVSSLEAQNGIPLNKPRFETSYSSKQYTDEDFLHDRGVSLDDGQSRQIYDLTQPLKNFSAKHLNTPPTAEEFNEIIPHIRLLYGLLTDQNTKIQDSQQNLSWGYIADACAAAVKVKNFSCDNNDSVFIKSLLLECSFSLDPKPYPENDKHFDEHPSWGGAVRVDAASGIISLARHQSCLDYAVLTRIEELGLRDEVPAVRYQIASRINSIYQTAPHLMWSMLKYICQNEPRNGILSSLVSGPLHTLAQFHPDEATELVKIIFLRINDGPGAKDVRKNCATIFLGLSLWRKNPTCGELISEIINSPSNYNDAVSQIIFELRGFLNMGLDDLSNKERENLRTESFYILENIVSTLAQEISALENKNTQAPFHLWPEEDQAKGKKLVLLVDSAGNQIYFASGAYNDKSSYNNETNIPMQTEARQLFMENSLKVLNLLSEFGYGSLTHHLLETLEFFIPYDPAKIFLIIGKVVQSGKRSGYQYDSFASELVVKIIERFLAEFRYIFRKNEDCRKVLIEILDVFVEAGWSSARRLTYGVEDIFR